MGLIMRELLYPGFMLDRCPYRGFAVATAAILPAAFMSILAVPAIPAGEFFTRRDHVDGAVLFHSQVEARYHFLQSLGEFSQG